MKILKILVGIISLFSVLPLSIQAAPLAGVTLKAEVVQKGLNRPVFVTAPAGDARLFVLEQTGRIVIIENGVQRAQAFLDISSIIRAGGERGLLGLAFHPDYANNGRFFVNYTNLNGDTRIVAYKVSQDDANIADPNSALELLAIDQPFANHNCGWMAFGPDGFLYIGMGDGGSGGDPNNNAQNLNSLLGKILRIDVNSGSPYSVPRDNPFVKGGGAPEIFVYGVRNPWRSAFDGDNLYIADVGQSKLEEISVISTTNAGANMGWPIMEGTKCFRPTDCSADGITLPVHEYSHNEGCSLTGGFVYRGRAIPELNGHYLFADYCTGFVRSFLFAGGSATDVTDWSSQLGDLGNITSFGRDGQGEMYVMNADGDLFKIVRSGRAL